MIKESAYQKLCFAMGIAKKKGFDGKERLSFVRKILHTNFAGEISDNYSEEGTTVYKDIFPAKQFSTEDIEKIIVDCIEVPQPMEKVTEKVSNVLKKGKEVEKAKV